jgi:hypothetical protein
MSTVIQQAYKKVVAEETRLLAQLAKVRAIKSAMEGVGGVAVNGHARRKAPAGTLHTAILEQLGASERPMNNSELRESLMADGYGFSLKPIHVGKTLAMLLEDKKVKRIGKNSGAKYTLARKA